VFVCVCLCRNNDQASLQHLVFNMHDSDIDKFDDVIRHNSTMDSTTRRALYSKIRCQIAHNFELARKTDKSQICRYCRMKAGTLNEYVAFIYFTETPEFGVGTSASQGEAVPPVVHKTSPTGMDVNMGTTGSDDHGTDSNVSKTAVDDPTEIRSQSRDILGEVIQRDRSEKMKELAPHDSVAEEREAGDVRTSRPEAAQTSSAVELQANIYAGISGDQDGQRGKVIGQIIQLKSDTKQTSASELPDVEPKVTTQTSHAVEQLADDDAVITEDQAGQTGKVIGKTVQLKTGTKKVPTLLLSELSDVEPDDETSCPTELDGAVEEQPHLVSEVEGAKKSTDKIVTGNLSGWSHEQKAETEEQPHLMGEVYAAEQSRDDIVAGNSSECNAWSEVSSSVDDSADASEVLYEWKPDMVLKPNLDSSSDDVELKNTEFRKLSDWLCSTTDPTTTFHRYPTLCDLPVLAPQKNPERSVTWRLAEKFEPSKPTKSEPGNVMCDEGLTNGNRKPASDVIFIGPYDPSVIRHGEVVRRRVSHICDELLPYSASDIICVNDVTDIGSDVQLTRLRDIVVSYPELLAAAQFAAYTAVDPNATHVSCVLLKFRPSTQ